MKTTIEESDNFSYFTEKTRAGLKIYRSKDKKHLKTVPAIYESVVSKFIYKLDFEKIRLSENERILLDTFDYYIEYNSFLSKLQKEQPYLFEIIDNQEIVSMRKVHCRDSMRFEIIYENKTKICASEKLFNLFLGEKLPDAYLNY